MTSIENEWEATFWSTAPPEKIYLIGVAGSDDPHTLGITLVLNREVRRRKGTRRSLQVRSTCFN